MRIDLPGARVERTSDGHCFLFEEHFGYAYLLSDSAAVLAELLLTGDPTEVQLATELRDRFAVGDGANVERDVLAFIDRLRGYGILV